MLLLFVSVTFTVIIVIVVVVATKEKKSQRNNIERLKRANVDWFTQCCLICQLIYPATKRATRGQQVLRLKRSFLLNLQTKQRTKFLYFASQIPIITLKPLEICAKYHVNTFRIEFESNLFVWFQFYIVES